MHPQYYVVILDFIPDDWAFSQSNSFSLTELSVLVLIKLQKYVLAIPN